MSTLAPPEPVVNLTAVLQHPRMPSYLRRTYLELQASERDGSFWDWSTDEDVLQLSRARARVPVP